jgi:hypothetical protein
MIKMSKPSDSKTLFLVCDSARQEVGGKATLIGFFGSEEVWIAKGTPLPVGFPVSFVFVFRDGEGSFSATVELLSPSKVQIGGVQTMPTVIKESRKSATVMINIPMFVFTELGTYTVILSLDGTRYTRTLTIGYEP